MKVNNITLKNFQSYEKESVNFEEGVSILYGRNGAGKSSLLRAMFCSLFQSKAVNEMKGIEIGDLVSKGAKTSEVRMEFESDGKEYESLWKFEVDDEGNAGTKKCYIKHNGKTISGVRDVNKFVEEEITGMDAKSYTNSSYIQQSELTALINSGVKERKKIFDGLLGLDKIEDYKKRAIKARREAKSSRNKYEGKREEIQRQLNEKKNFKQLKQTHKELKSQKSEEEQKLKELTNKKQEIKNKIDKLRERREKESSLLKELEEKEDLLDKKKEKKKDLSSTIKEIDNKIKEKKKKILRLEKEANLEDFPFENFEIEESKSYLKDKKEEAKELEMKASKIKQKKSSKSNTLDEISSKIEELKNEKEEMESKLDEIEDKLKQLGAVDIDFDFEYLKELNESIEEIWDRINGAECFASELEERKRIKDNHLQILSNEVDESILSDIKPSDDIVERIDKLNERVENRKQELEEKTNKRDNLVEKIVKLSDDLDKILELKSSESEISNLVEDIQRRIDEKESRADSLRQEIENFNSKRKDKKLEIQNVKEEIENAESILSDIKERNEHRDKIPELKEKKSDKRDVLDSIKQQIKDLESRIDTIKEDVSNKPGEIEEKIERNESEKKKIEQKIGNIEDSIERKASSIMDAEKELEKIDNLKSEKEKVEKDIERANKIVEETNSVINSYDEVKLELRRRSVSMMNKYANEVFSEIYNNDEYTRIIIGNNYELTLLNSDGEEVKPNLSSGGESAIINIALRASLYKVISSKSNGSELPPLIMDEPTTYLDDGHVERLSDLIEIVKNWAVKQVIVVSHNQTLIDNADHAYEVKKKDSSIVSKKNN